LRDKRPLPLLVAALLLTAVVCGARQAAPPTAPIASFASQIAALSERGGYFNTDNLISNEHSYLDVVPALRQAALRGGVYVGVGPDQNFSYIAQLKPARAFIIDIRRDNLLLHLLFKALYGMARSRVEYVALLCGRPLPARIAEWRDAPIDRLVGYIDGTAADAKAADVQRRRAETLIKGFGVPLSPEDLQTIDRFHQRFVDAGLDLKFQTTGRPPQGYYPTYRDLLLATDQQGHHWNFLATEEDFQFVRALEARDAVVPIVGDLAGPTAMAAYSRLASLGAIARFAWVIAPLCGSPLVSCFHVVPPSVDLKIPPPVPRHCAFSHGPCRSSHKVA